MIKSALLKRNLLWIILLGILIRPDVLLAQSTEKVSDVKSEDALNQATMVHKDSIVQRPSFDSIQTIFQRLQSYEQILIKTNLDSLIAHKKIPKEQAATLMAMGEDVPTVIFSVQLEQRGVYRRLRCEYPPVRINFSKKDLDSLGMYPAYDKLKLVTECKQENVDTASIMREYWSYKLFNQVTEKSFAVHQLAVTYEHDQDSSRIIKSHAFILENVNELAHRIGGFVYNSLGKTAKDVELSSYQNVLLFNYMIGNTDWIIKSQKNIKLIRLPTINKKILIPYDFDFTALVHPPYWRLVPINGEYPDRANRFAMGHYLNWEVFLTTIEKFKSLQKTGFTCYQECPRLSKQDKKNMKIYLNSFFHLLKNKRKVKETFGRVH